MRERLTDQHRDDVKVEMVPDGRFDAIGTLRGNALQRARFAVVENMIGEICARAGCAGCEQTVRDALDWCGLRENEDYQVTDTSDGTTLVVLATSDFGREVLWPFFPAAGEA